jgi:hypothetical protein
VTIRIDVAPKDVDEALADALHAAVECTGRAILLLPFLHRNPGKNAEGEAKDRRFCNPGVRMGSRNCESGFRAR